MRIFHNLILTILIIWNRGKSSPRLKEWLELEAYKEKIIKAVENGHVDFPKYLLAYLSTAFHVNSKWFEYARWELLVSAFYLHIRRSPKLSLPIVTPSTEEHKDDPWEYDGRNWHHYSHMLAKNYGWNLEYISCLHVDEALAKIQEIVVDEQLDKEFYYGLSEMAYIYDSRAKVSKFKPMPRPHWMRVKVTEIKDVKRFSIPASMLPSGNVVMSGIPDELKPKEIINP